MLWFSEERDLWFSEAVDELFSNDDNKKDHALDLDRTPTSVDPHFLFFVFGIFWFQNNL